MVMGWPSSAAVWCYCGVVWWYYHSTVGTVVLLFSGGGVVVLLSHRWDAVLLTNVVFIPRIGIG